MAPVVTLGSWHEYDHFLNGEKYGDNLITKVCRFGMLDSKIGQRA